MRLARGVHRSFGVQPPAESRLRLGRRQRRLWVARAEGWWWPPVWDSSGEGQTAHVALGVALGPARRWSRVLLITPRS